MKISAIAAVTTVAIAVAVVVPSCEAGCNDMGPWDKLDAWARTVARHEGRIGEGEHIEPPLPYGTVCEVLHAMKVGLTDCEADLGGGVAGPEDFFNKTQQGAIIL